MRSVSNITIIILLLYWVTVNELKNRNRKEHIENMHSERTGQIFGCTFITTDKPAIGEN